MLRMLISLIVDPGDRAQTREALRNFLDRWVAPPWRASAAIGFECEDLRLGCL